jgi:hypothetical protein
MADERVLYSDQTGIVPPPSDDIRYNREVGKKRYELKNHLGNVMAVITDKKIANMVGTDVYWLPEVKTVQDFYPFGMIQPERTWESDKYRYGFQAQEKVDEVKGSGNHYTSTYWEMDPRLGRRWNLDPVVKPWQSLYQTFSDNPIWRIDPNGDDDYKVNRKGKISFVKETEDKTDRLIAVSGGKEKIKYNKHGELKNRSMELEKGILSEKSEVTTKNEKGNDVKGLRLVFGDNEELSKRAFKFMSNNTDVEWGLIQTETEDLKTSLLYTSHLEDKEYFSPQTVLQISTLNNVISLKHYHNHPRAFGENLYGIPSDADIDFRNKVRKNYPNAKFFIHEQGQEYEYTNRKW